MLQHEFESLTGLKINESQYEVINGMYGCSNNQTKQDFCKMFMAMELMSHVDYVVEMKRERAELRKGQVFLENRIVQLEAQLETMTEGYVAKTRKLEAIAEMVKGGAE